MKSIRAILAGALVGIILSIGTDAFMRAIGVFPSAGSLMSNSLFLLATFYRTVYGIGGSYLTARLAPSRPMTHSLVLGSFGLFASIAGAVAAWNKVAELGPRWYPLALVATALPTAWLGAKLFERRR